MARFVVFPRGFSRVGVVTHYARLRAQPALQSWFGKSLICGFSRPERAVVRLDLALRQLGGKFLHTVGRDLSFAYVQRLQLLEWLQVLKPRVAESL
jgi:hypothetical protein